MLLNKLGDISLILLLDVLRALTLSCLQKNRLGFIAWWLVRVLFKHGCQMYWHFFVAKVSFISFCLFGFLRAWKVFWRFVLYPCFLCLDFFVFSHWKRMLFCLLRMSNVDAPQLGPLKAQVATCIPHNWCLNVGDLSLSTMGGLLICWNYKYCNA